MEQMSLKYGLYRRISDDEAVKTRGICSVVVAYVDFIEIEKGEQRIFFCTQSGKRILPLNERLPLHPNDKVRIHYFKPVGESGVISKIKGLEMLLEDAETVGIRWKKELSDDGTSSENYNWVPLDVKSEGKCETEKIELVQD